jgi:hypothetical protein
MAQLKVLRSLSSMSFEAGYRSFAFALHAMLLNNFNWRTLFDRKQKTWTNNEPGMKKVNAQSFNKVAHFIKESTKKHRFSKQIDKKSWEIKFFNYFSYSLSVDYTYI